MNKIHLRQGRDFLTSSSIPVKVVAGAVVGGLVAVAVIIGGLLYWRRKRSRPMEIHSQPYVSSSHPPDVRPQQSRTIDLPGDEQLAYTQTHVPAMALAVARIQQEGGIPWDSSASIRRGNTSATMPPGYKE